IFSVRALKMVPGPQKFNLKFGCFLKPDGERVGAALRHLHHQMKRDVAISRSSQLNDLCTRFSRILLFALAQVRFYNFSEWVRPRIFGKGFQPCLLIDAGSWKTRCYHQQQKSENLKRMS